MTQEEKQLLLKDLCARLPYEVKINIYDDYSGTMKDEELNVFHLNSTYSIEYRKLRPYLRPMSSMTEEEEYKYHQYKNIDYLEIYNQEHHEIVKATALVFSNAIDWLNAHHFDYRGLIKMGLAIEAPDGMYKTE